MRSSGLLRNKLLKRKKTDKNVQVREATRYISEKESRLLWVRSGGRCARCNKYLLEEKYHELPINLAQRAHIAGWTDTPGSPRGDSTIPIIERNDADNLILLCYDCHKPIDDPQSRHLYPEEFLQAIKFDHEERIFHLTDMARDRETTVLRVFGSVRGSMPELARTEVLRTVIDGAGRYARFPLAFDKHSVEVNLAFVSEPETLPDGSYWRHGQTQIDEALKRIAEGVRDKHIRHLSIFALARIPLLVYLGYALDDKVPVDLYQKHRGDNEGWLWPEDAPVTSFEVIERRKGDTEGSIAVMLSLSGTIPLTDLPADVQGLSVFEIQPVDATPNPNLFRSRATLEAFNRTYQNFLSELERTHRSANTIHLFLAAPITAAISCGRLLMRHVQPVLMVYDRIGNEFQPALKVNQR